jgi:hypothetical protein
MELQTSGASLGPILIGLLPFIIASLLAPIPISVVLFLLLQNPEQGLHKASAFLGGKIMVRVLPIMFFGPILLSSASIAAQPRDGERGPVISAFLLMLGILLLIAAYKKWNKEEDPDAPPPKWLAMLESLTTLKAFGIGFGMMVISSKFWIFSLSALATIGEGHLGLPASVVAYLLFALLAETLLLVPLLIRIFLPQRSQSVLEAMSTWVDAYSPLILVVAFLVLGLLFLYLGATGLLV